MDGPHLVARADFILHMFKRGDPGVESLWPDLARDDLLKEHRQWGLCPGVAEWMVERRPELERWPEEKLWALKNMDALAAQLGKIIKATKPDGMDLYTKRGARQFSSLGKKDFVSAAMYCYAAFLMWLASDAWRTSVAPEDASGFSGWSGSAAVNRIPDGQGRIHL